VKRRAQIGGPVEAGSRLASSAREQAVLDAAAANDGWVTPAMVARQVPHLGLDEAKATLDGLLAAGHCSMDSNDEGQLYYHFAMGGKPGRSEELSPEEWVERTARLLEPADDTTSAGSAEIETRDGTR
jgi:hypothetical protein